MHLAIQQLSSVLHLLTTRSDVRSLLSDAAAQRIIQSCCVSGAYEQALVLIDSMGHGDTPLTTGETQPPHNSDTRTASRLYASYLAHLPNDAPVDSVTPLVSAILQSKVVLRPSALGSLFAFLCHYRRVDELLQLFHHFDHKFAGGKGDGAPHSVAADGNAVSPINAIHYHYLIKCLLRNGRLPEALETYTALVASHHQPRPSTCSLLLRAVCHHTGFRLRRSRMQTHVPSPVHGTTTPHPPPHPRPMPSPAFVQQVVADWLMGLDGEPNEEWFHVTIRAHASVEDKDAMYTQYRRMQRAGLVAPVPLYDTMIGAYVTASEHGRWWRATFALFHDMVSGGSKPSRTTYLWLLDMCTQGERSLYIYL